MTATEQVSRRRLQTPKWVGQHRWWELAPEIVLLLGLAIFFVQDMDAATSAFKSGRARALVGLTVLLWLVGRVVLDRFVKWRVARTGVFAVAAVAILAVVVVPAYHTTTVVETFPRAVQPAPPAPASSSPSPSTQVAAPPRTRAEPVRFRVGSFRGVDHRAAGTVALYRQPDGRYVVGLERFDIQPGPNYDLYVVPGTQRQSRRGGMRVDDLRGNKGTQYSDVPRGVDLASGPWTVLVWCQTFAVPIATATPV
jgi:hypothetical protein